MSPFPSTENLSRRQLLMAGVAASLSATACGQDDGAIAKIDETSSDVTGETATRLSYQSPQIQNWRIGLILETPVTCTDVLATFAVPMDWPEQKVTLTGQTISPLVSGWETRELPGGARQVVLRMERVPGGSTVEMTFTYQIERSRILAPHKTDDLTTPSCPDRGLRMYTGNSPYIDASNGRIKAASRELAKVEVENDWGRVEQIYDFVREQVEYVEGSLKNASQALRDGKGTAKK